MRPVDPPPRYPHGTGPSTDQQLLLRTGVQLYEHPMTPFEALVLRCALGCGMTLLQVVAGLRQACTESSARNTQVLACLDWMTTRVRAADERRDQARQRTHGYLDRAVGRAVDAAHQSMDLAAGKCHPEHIPCSRCGGCHTETWHDRHAAAGQ